jgi:hypothetical protein
MVGMNPKPDNRMVGLLYANTFGALTAEERKELYESAAADPDLFALLMEMEDLRGAMESPELRRAVLNELAPPRPKKLRSESWAPWWTLAWAAAGVCAALVGFAILQRPSEPPAELAFQSPSGDLRTPSPATPPVGAGAAKKASPSPAHADLEAARVHATDPLLPVFNLEIQHSLAAVADWAGSGLAHSATARVHAGESLKIHISSADKAVAWAFERDPKGAIRLLTPSEGIPIPAGESAFSVSSSGALPNSAAPRGERIVRIVVMGPDERLFRDGVVDTRGVSGPTAVMDLHFTVEER